MLGRTAYRVPKAFPARSRLSPLPLYQQLRCYTSPIEEPSRRHLRQQGSNSPSRYPSRSASIRHASSASSSSLKETPLYDLHTSLGAKMGPFAGYSMPLTYPPHSHADSHLWTRKSASIFDVSHMVQHKLSGPLAEEFLMTITPSALDTIPKHTSTLSCLLNEDGGIVDDTVITRLGRDSFYFVTNAGCRDQDLGFIQTQLDKFLESKSASSSKDQKPITWHVLDHHSLIALQGPLAQELLQPLIHVDEDDAQVDTDLSSLYFSHSRWLQVDIPESCSNEGTSLSTPSLLISRTGYTGEDGFEISIPPESGSSAGLAQSITKALLQAKVDGSDEPACRMAGLAARDSLRLEAGMCLYGHDIGMDVTPPMAGLGWTVAKSRRNNSEPKFNGAEVINEQLATPKSMERRRVGFLIESGPRSEGGCGDSSDEGRRQ